MSLEFIPLTIQYIETVRAWRNSPEVSQYMYTSGDINSQEQLKWYENVSKDESCEYFIISFNSSPIGLVSLTQIDLKNLKCYWAFYIGDSNNRGGGIGAKVEYKLIEYVFNQLGINKLCCEVFIFNEKVIQLHEKFGFRKESFFRQHIKKDGKYYDVIGLSLLRQDWILIKDTLNNKIFKNK